MLRLSLLPVVALFVLACGESDGLVITPSVYGPGWPLTVPHVTLHCEEMEVTLLGKTSEEPLVWVESNEYAYPVNGTAKSFLRDSKPDLDVRDLWRIQKDREDLLSTMPFINEGLAMCERG